MTTSLAFPLGDAQPLTDTTNKVCSITCLLCFGIAHVHDDTEFIGQLRRKIFLDAVESSFGQCLGHCDQRIVCPSVRIYRSSLLDSLNHFCHLHSVLLSEALDRKSTRLNSSHVAI